MLLFSGALFLALYLGGMNMGENLIITGMTAMIFLLVTLCLFSDTTKNRFSVESGHRIFTSGESRRPMADPIFLRQVDGVLRPVALRFTTPYRVLRMALLAVVALFLPVIIALFLNGFDFGRLELGGSAVWFCIVVPTLPVYILKFAIEELYDRPWIYVIQEDGRRKRYRKKREPIGIDWHMVLSALFVPPYCLGTWFAIISFITMVYLTAGYGW